MKLSIFLVASVLTLCFSCKKDMPIEQPLKDLLLSGGWTISEMSGFFVEPIDYTGYTLVFNPDGTMVVNSDTSSANGTWRTYGVLDTEVRLALDPEGEDFIHLEAHWTADSLTSTQVGLHSGSFLLNHMVLVKD